MKTFKHRQAGYSLVELVFYVSIFAVLSIAIINSLITMTKSFKETSIQAEFTQSANIMERISREIRQAYSINTISSSSLKLDSRDAAGVDKIIEFVLTGTNLLYYENNIFIGNLNQPNIVVSSISFTKIETIKSKAVKVSFSVQSVPDSFARTVNFYDTVVLRGGY